MLSRLSKGLNEEETKRVRASYLEALSFRKELTRVLDEDIESLRTSMESEELLSNPNWTLVQADRVAQIKVLKKIKNILK